MEREGGVVGRLLGHGVLDKRIPPLWESRPEDFHLAGEILALATGLIVHSRYVEERRARSRVRGPDLAHPAPGLAHPRSCLPRIEGSPLIGSFGNVNTSKRIPQLLEAFARLRRERPDARLLLVGAVSPGFDLDRRLQRLGLTGEGITREAYVEEDRLWSLMAACDVCVNLRSPTMGETSGSVIRQLSLGKPVVVSDVGWFSELPDEVALKVPVDAAETETLQAALELLARDERPAAPCRPQRSSSSAASTTSAAPPTCTSRRSSRLQAARRSRTRCSGPSPRRGRSRDRARLARGRGARAATRRGRAWEIGCGPSCPGAGSPRSSSARSRSARGLRAGMLGPFIMVDELIYSELARSVAAGAGFQVRGLPASGFSLVYPVLISPAYALFDALPDAYAAVKTLNALLMSLGRRPRLPPRAPGARAAALAAGGPDRGRAPIPRLHRHRDDGERLLPALPHGCAPARARAGAADTGAAGGPAGARRAPVRDPRAGGCVPARDRGGAVPARPARPHGRCARPWAASGSSTPCSPAAPCSSSARRSLGAARSPTCSAPTRSSASAPTTPARSCASSSTTSRSSTSTSASCPSPRSSSSCCWLGGWTAPWRRSSPRGRALHVGPARRRRVRVRVREPDPGAEHLRRRAVLPDRAARLGRPRAAAAATRDRRSRSRRRCCR